MAVVTALRPEHLPALYRLYRAQTDGLPHCLPPSAARFGADLQGFDPDRMIVAEQGGVACGFAAVAQVKDDQSNEGDALTALFFEDEPAGQALLDACAARSPAPLLAFPQAHGHGPIQAYNVGWHGLSDRLPAVTRLLTRNGYVPYYRELHLSASLSGDLPEAATIAGIDMLAGIGERGNFLQRAWVGEARLGLCIYQLLADKSDDPRAARTGYVDWLWVDDSLRRRGVARSLMLRAMAHLREIGCEACWLTTGADNWPAQPLYFSLGFEVVDCSACFRRG
jgi:ribosomal protein S18 acetylase RimI-like enzyme